VPGLLVHGHGDESVPVEQSEAYAAAAARAGDRVVLAVVPGDHMHVIDPTTSSWARVVGWVLDLVGRHRR
jgi:dipeptidyl aminopeptidase/acylaminoacyl peptidase